MMLCTGVKLGAAGGWCSCGSVGLDSRVLGNVPNPGGSAGSLKVALAKGESTDGAGRFPQSQACAPACQSRVWREGFQADRIVHAVISSGDLWGTPNREGRQPGN